ncbi:hypothetical protein NKH77_28395 [Streptomyces sp. M19]
MADWIASGLAGVDRISEVTFARALDRATGRWTRLGLRGGWGELPAPRPDGLADAFAARFGRRRGRCRPSRWRWPG